MDTLLPLRLLDVLAGVFEIGALRCSLVLDPEVFLLLHVPEVPWYRLAVHVRDVVVASLDALQIVGWKSVRSTKKDE